MTAQTPAAAEEAAGGGGWPLRKAYRALLVLWLVHAIANIDRFSVGLVAQAIKADLQLSDTQLGIFTGAAFVVAYVLVGFPMARWLDRGPRARILAGALAFWSATTMLCGAAANFVQLLVARAGVGAGESACVPGALSLLADYFPRARRAQAIGIFQSALPAAGIVGTPIIGWVADHYGWRAALYAMGGAGTALAVVVVLALREPLRRAPLAAAGSAPGAASPASKPGGLWGDLREMFAIKAFLYLMIGHGIYSIGIFSFVTWYGISLVRGHGMTYTELGLYLGTGLGIVMVLASLASGFLGSRLVRRTGNERWMATLPALFCLLSVPALVVACADVSTGVSLVAGTVAFALTIARTPLILTLSVNLLPAHMRSTGTLVFLLATNIAGSAAGPLITGMISDALTPGLGAVVALRHALMWTVPTFCALGALLAFLPAPYMARVAAADPGDALPTPHRANP